ncbi:hypothetical protein GCM10018771_21210 [Streptomyces cellulosae]|nr:hypothetical protein GCM10018771_21210 [Streptomyces cellulosae]
MVATVACGAYGGPAGVIKLAPEKGAGFGRGYWRGGFVAICRVRLGGLLAPTRRSRTSLQSRAPEGVVQTLPGQEAELVPRDRVFFLRIVCQS